MQIEERVETLQKETAQLKKELQVILTNIRIFLLEAQNPIRIKGDQTETQDEKTSPADEQPKKEEKSR